MTERVRLKNDPALRSFLFCLDVHPTESGSVARIPLTFTDVFSSVGFPEFPHPFEFLMAATWVGFDTRPHHVTVDVRYQSGRKVFEAADYTFALDNITLPHTQITRLTGVFAEPMMLFFVIGLDGRVVERFPFQIYRKVQDV